MVVQTTQEQAINEKKKIMTVKFMYEVYLAGTEERPCVLFGQGIQGLIIAKHPCL